jgi:hypothetical protein
MSERGVWIERGLPFFCVLLFPRPARVCGPAPFGWLLLGFSCKELARREMKKA